MNFQYLIILSLAASQLGYAFIRDGSAEGFIRAAADGVAPTVDAIYGGSSPESVQDALSQLKSNTVGATGALRESPTDFINTATGEFKSRYEATRAAMSATQSQMRDSTPSAITDTHDAIVQKYEDMKSNMPNTRENIANARENLSHVGENIPVTREDIEAHYAQLREKILEMPTNVPDTREAVKNRYADLKAEVESFPNNLPPAIADKYNQLRESRSALPEDLAAMQQQLNAKYEDLKVSIQEMDLNERAADPFAAYPELKDIYNKAAEYVPTGVSDAYSYARDSATDAAVNTRNKVKSMLERRKTDPDAPVDDIIEGQSFSRNLQEFQNLQDLKDYLQSTQDNVKAGVEVMAPELTERAEQTRQAFQRNANRFRDDTEERIRKGMQEIGNARNKLRDSANEASERVAGLFGRKQEDEPIQGRRLSSSGEQNVRNKLQELIQQVPNNLTPLEKLQLNAVTEKLQNTGERRLLYSRDGVVDCPSCNAEEGTMGITSIPNTPVPAPVSEEDVTLLSKLLSKKSGDEKAERKKIFDILGDSNSKLADVFNKDRTPKQARAKNVRNH